MDELEKTALMLQAIIVVIEIEYNKRTSDVFARTPDSRKRTMDYKYAGSKSHAMHDILAYGSEFYSPVTGEYKNKDKWYQVHRWGMNLKYAKSRTLTFYGTPEVGCFRVKDSATDTDIWFV